MNDQDELELSLQIGNDEPMTLDDAITSTILAEGLADTVTRTNLVPPFPRGYVLDGPVDAVAEARELVDAKVIPAFHATREELARRIEQWDDEELPRWEQFTEAQKEDYRLMGQAAASHALKQLSDYFADELGNEEVAMAVYRWASPRGLSWEGEVTIEDLRKWGMTEE